jgi:hypothetical protein
MDKSKVNAIACENDERLPLINLKCEDTFIDLMKLTKTYEMLARCPSPDDCLRYKSAQFDQGERVD